MPRSINRYILALYLALAAVAAVQRGILTETHATFPVFRQSFVHLSEGRDLYAAYPAEQGPEDRDRFKYSPTAALFFAPFAFLPLVVALFFWTALNAIALYAAVRCLTPGRDEPWALLIVFPALIAAIQSTSSNALVAALMIGGFVALERRSIVGAAGAIVSGTLMKLYPAAAASFVLSHPRRWQVVGIFLAVAAAAVAAPLLVVSPAELAAQYRSWIAVLLADGRDLTFARSIMVVIREWTGTEVSNLAIQVPATLLLLVPIVARGVAMADAGYRRTLLASILVYVVIFNHQSENASYVIAAVGLAVWFLGSP
ncbi:MAG: glycosyltransferase family 87 protein, partial [Gemmatimonadales bacterium]